LSRRGRFLFARNKRRQEHRDTTMASLAGTVFASAARTATPTAVEINMQRCRGIRISIDCTASAATPSVLFAIKTKDPLPATPVYTAVLTSAAVTGASHVEMAVYPDITAAANVTASAILSDVVQITATHADADSITYSVSYNLIP
jgi:hypothetical protein